MVKANTRAVLADNIRRLRLRCGWSQEQLAEQCGLHRTYVGAIERGERNLGLDNLERLARALNVPAARLLTDLQQQPDRIREPRGLYQARYRPGKGACSSVLQPALCRISAPLCYS